ncbi:DUF58 domain-containing protein [Dialister sp.]|uniref:DUF58 domain-containing protein n=1 Tax=Dialister sp. TaxID=1955814 RepID=UPI002E81F384|nr:DUF58 domain-containing protein [Dialister sp.]MEE3453347.1 DUF58 domain-containing protein [Dialister sp.]
MGRLYYLIVLFIAFLIMVLYDLQGAFLLSLVMILTPLPLYFLERKLAPKLILTLSAPKSVRRGENLEVALTVKGPFSFLLASPDASLNGIPYETYEEENGKLTFYFEKEALHCGRVDLGKPSISWTDPFGLFHFHKEAAPSDCLVFPKQVGNAGSILESLRRLSASDEVEYFGATEYNPGDNPHLINWKITARKEDVFVRDSYPAESEKFVLAADYEENEEYRDIIGDALYSAGLALLSVPSSFRFAFTTKAGPVSQMIRTRDDWEEAIRGFLEAGQAQALRESPLSPYVPIVYLTGDPDPPVSPVLHPAIWCVAPDAPRAMLSGKGEIYEALGGGK